MSDIAGRKLQYIDLEATRIDESRLEGDAHQVWGKWWLNHVRLFQGKELDKANAWFETFSIAAQEYTGLDKVRTVVCDNFKGTKYLKTLLDFGDSPRLSDKAKAHLREELLAWVPHITAAGLDNTRQAVYPVIHTENHDLMALTIGLFNEVLSGRDGREHIRALSRFLAWRFDPGFEEWQSHVYQGIFMFPLMILMRHAPDANLRQGATQLANLIFAERALLSVNGHMPGPFIRGYQGNCDDDRNDNLLPAIWMYHGYPSINPLVAVNGGDFAVDPFEPHPLVLALARDVTKLPVLEYRGTRPAGMKGRQTIVYYNTPHVGMGSMQVAFYRYQARYFNVMFASDPSKSLRIDLPDTVQHSVWDHRNDKGMVAQYRNWLVSIGTLVVNGGLKPQRAGDWDLYREGKGLCAHIELPGKVHVFQIGDLDQYADERAFLSALHMPSIVGNSVEGIALDGAKLRVRLDNMRMSINGKPRADWRELMHDCPLMFSRYGTGTVEIKTSEGKLTLSNKDLLANLA